MSPFAEATLSRRQANPAPRLRPTSYWRARRELTTPKREPQARGPWVGEIAALMVRDVVTVNGNARREIKLTRQSGQRGARWFYPPVAPVGIRGDMRG
jgi:hypothetical protein